MDAVSVAASLVAIVNFASHTLIRLQDLRHPQLAFGGITQEVRQLRSALHKLQTDLKPGNGMIYDENYTERLDGNEATSRLWKVLNETKRVMFDLDKKLTGLTDSSSLADGSEMATKWAAKMRVQREQILLMQHNVQGHVKLNGTLGPQSTPSTGQSTLGSSQSSPRSDRACDAKWGPFWCTSRAKGFTPSLECEWKRHAEEQELSHPILRTTRWFKTSEHGQGIAMSLTSATGSVLTAICMRNFDQPHHDPYQKDLQPTRLEPSFLKPTPTDFVAATIAHGLSTLLYYHSRKADRYREWFLATGALVAAGGGLLARLDAQGILLSIMPLASIISLVMCTAANAMRDYCKSHQPWHIDVVEKGLDEKSDGPDNEP